MPTSVSRAAGIALTKAMSKDLAKDNILVNTVCIGRIKSAQLARTAQAGAPAAGLDEAGVIRIRLEVSDHGRQAHSGQVQEALEQAVANAAPEAAGVAFDLVTAAPELPLLQISRRQAATAP